MKRVILGSIALILVLASLWCVGLFWFLSLIPQSPAANDSKTEAIVVLTGGSLRLDHGFDLLLQDKAPKLFISGVEEGVTLESLLARSRDGTQYSNVPKAAITLGYKARSTSGNAEETAGWAYENNIRSVRLVTSNYHMPRSLHELSVTAPELTIIADPVFPRGYGAEEWWRNSQSVTLVLLEYHKFMVTLLRQMAIR